MSETLIQDVVRLEEQLAEAERKRDDIANTEPLNQWAYEEAISACNLISNRLSEKRYELEQIQQRAQVQAQKIEAVDEMELPYDFNDIFENAGANDLIRALLKDQYSSLFADHNADMAELRADYQDKLRAADEREIELKRQNDHLQAQIELVAENRDQLQTEAQLLRDKVRELSDELQDRETKLRNAAAEIDRLNSHVADLQEQVANAPAPAVNIIDITPKPSPSLDELVNKAKAESKRKLLDVKPIGNGNWVEGVNPETGKIEVVHKTELIEPEPPEVEPVGEASFLHESGANSETNASDHGIHPAEAPQVADTFPETAEQRVDGSADAGLAVVTREEFEALKGRVEALERVRVVA